MALATVVLPVDGRPTRMTLRCSSMKRHVRSSLTTWGESWGRAAQSKPSRERGGPSLLQRRRRWSLRSQREPCSASRSWWRNAEYAGCVASAWASRSGRQRAAVVRLSRSRSVRTGARESCGSALRVMIGSSGRGHGVQRVVVQGAGVRVVEGAERLGARGQRAQGGFGDDGGVRALEDALDGACVEVAVGRGACQRGLHGVVTIEVHELVDGAQVNGGERRHPVGEPVEKRTGVGEAREEGGFLGGAREGRAGLA